MRKIVQKFGGSSVANIDKIKLVASIVAKTASENKHVVVVLSAMMKTTDALYDLANKANSNSLKAGRELDVLLATGEQQTVALLSMVLIDMGLKAKSLFFHQIGMITNDDHSNAIITELRGESIEGLLERGIIPVIAGYQGCSSNGDITTLGRGGSDLSAVAIAAAINADICEIYTDVDGVYTADPNVCSKARKIDTISYYEMLNLSNLGAKVMQSRSIELANKYGVKIMVKKSCMEEKEGKGTLIVSENYMNERELKSATISGITCDLNHALINVCNIPCKSSVVSKILDSISRENIVVDMIVQSWCSGNLSTLALTIPRNNYSNSMELIENFAKYSYDGKLYVFGNDNVAQVSVVGSMMKTSCGTASTMVSSLGEKDIEILAISTSEIRISCVVEEKYAKHAIESLHDKFDLSC